MNILQSYTMYKEFGEYFFMFVIELSVEKTLLLNEINNIVWMTSFNYVYDLNNVFV